MDCITILAQTVETAGETPEAPEGAIVPIDRFWECVTSLDKLEAFTFIAFGVVCLFYGWRVFRILVAISFALIGLFVGIWINELLINGNEIWLGIICMALFAFFSVPLMRWGVSILGAAAGGILTGGGWYAAGLPEQYIWAGIIIGVVAGGMISFIIFKAAVMLFTSLGGSALVVVGILAIMYRYSGAAEQIQELVFTHNWFLPAILLVPMAAGMLLQNRFIKRSKDWHV